MIIKFAFLPNNLNYIKLKKENITIIYINLKNKL